MMKQLNPHAEKYHTYYMDIAIRAAQQSVAVRRKVGAVIVTNTGLMAVGWNGTPSGFDNRCETHDVITKPEVIHAERNALDKLTKQGVSTQNSILFVTTAPCNECAKSIHAVGVSSVYYLVTQSNTNGLQFLHKAGVPTTKMKLNKDI
jgi:dCMP deaminase